MPDPDLISTAELCGELKKIAAEPDKVPGYRPLADRTRDALWPVTRVNGRLYVRRGDLALVATAIGLELKSGGAPKASASKPSRRARVAA